MMFSNDPLGLAERFDKTHGDCVLYDYRYWFQDGARREKDCLGLLEEPPADKYECARRVAVYRKIIFERAVRAFDEAKRNLLSMADANLHQPRCGPAPEIKGATAQLLNLKQRALDAKGAYDAVLAEIEKHKPQQFRMAEQMEIQNRQRNEEVLAAVKEITI